MVNPLYLGPLCLGASCSNVKMMQIVALACSVKNEHNQIPAKQKAETFEQFIQIC